MSDVDKILKSIKEWKNEAKNFRNDGWVQKGYREKIRLIFVESGKALSDLKKIK